MGVVGLWSFLRKKHPGVFTTVNLSTLAGKSVAIDFAIYAWRMGDVGVVEGVKRQVRHLQSHGMVPTYVFDGPKQAAKVHEHRRRAAAAAALQVNAHQRRAILAELEAPAAQVPEDGAPIGCDLRALAALVEHLAVPRDVAVALDEADAVRLQAGTDGALAPAPSAPSGRVGVENVIDYIVRREAAQVKADEKRQGYTPGDLEAVMAWLQAEGVTYHVACAEAEQLASQLNRQGEVDFVMTDDSDALPFGAVAILRRPDTAHTRAELVRTAEVRAALGITQLQLVDLCIACGCDFTCTRGLPNVGPVKALKLVQQHGSLDGLFDGLSGQGELAALARRAPDFDLAAFDYKAARAVFQDDRNQAAISVPSPTKTACGPSGGRGSAKRAAAVTHPEPAA